MASTETPPEDDEGSGMWPPPMPMDENDDNAADEEEQEREGLTDDAVVDSLPPMAMEESDGNSNIIMAEQEFQKEHAAAEIMATLKPSSSSDQQAAVSAGAVESPKAAAALPPTIAATDGPSTATKTKTTVAAAAAPPTKEKNPKQKKRKYPINRAKTGYVTPSASLPLRLLDDSEFVRVMAAEFRRRGYTVAIQLGSESESKSNERAEEDGQPKKEEEGESKSEESSEAKKAEVSAVVAAAAAATTTLNDDNIDDNISPEGGQSLVIPEFAFYPSTVSISAKNTKSWNKMFEKLKVFHEENCGVFPLHPSNNTSNSLVKWTKSQLTLWKRMKANSKHNLSLERIQMLQSLNFDQIVQWQNDPKKFMNTADNDEEDAAEQQRMAMMEPSGRNAQKWQQKFDELKNYKELHGDTNVPRSYDDSLSKWCATQRMRCKEVLNDDDAKTPMTPSQFQALEGIGFDMLRQRKIYDRSVIDKRWEERYIELIHYKEKFGNCDVAVRKGFEDYKQLANWAGLQRRKYKAKQTGTKAGRTTGITDDQIKKLASVGFPFHLQDDFDTRFKHLLEFKKEFGHTKVPVFYTGYNNLGRWAKRMRDGIRNEEPWMDEVRKTRLLGIDFDIAARHVFGHKPKKKTDDGEKELDEEMDEIEVEEVVGPVVEAQAVAAAATMARMDSTDYGRPSIPPFFYHGYPPAHL